MLFRSLAWKLGVDRVKAYHLFRPQPEVADQSLMEDMQRYAEQILPAALQRGAELGIDLQLAEPPGGSTDALIPRTCFLPWHESTASLRGFSFGGPVRLVHGATERPRMVIARANFIEDM